MLGRLAMAVALGVWLPAPASAFTIASGFSEGCHERIIADAYEAFLLDLPMRQILLPDGEEWRRVAPFLIESVGQDPDSLTERQQFLLVSLVVGVRSPDTDGHSILNLENLRALHTDPRPEGQYLHALRGLDDDGPEGELRAFEGTRAAIAASMREAEEVARLPPEEQTVRAEMFFDFYGRIDIEVWGPAFFVGRAAHTLADSFSHMIRDEEGGFREVVHVTNFIEAIGGDLQPFRDGLAHSVTLDDCAIPEVQPIFEAAIEATGDLFSSARELFRGRDPIAVEHVLDKWLNYRPGCGEDNEYCGNDHWAELALDEPTTPLICSIRVGRSPPFSLWLLSCVAFVLVWRRR